MNTFISKTTLGFSAALALGAASAVSAATVVNGSFEEDACSRRPRRFLKQGGGAVRSVDAEPLHHTKGVEVVVRCRC